MFDIRLKKADRLLLENFMPPFVVTFFIALFVLVMQTLWVYIDDIAGKGVGFFLMVELLSYMSVSMIPLALPIAVLISSVMVLGNMAERYELSSFKSAGVSLWRVLMPLIATTTVIAGFSFFCSNNLIPVSNLKFKSRLHDIRKQKPTLSLEEGVFNDDFEGYAIRIGKKMPDHRHIKDILLYDHSDAGEGRLLAVTADEGEMYATKDGDFFILHLKNGHQYAEPKPTKKGKDKTPNQPFSRTSFREWYKVFDLDEFEIDRTDESLFKSHHSMLNTRQLRVAIDSIDRAILDRLDKMAISNEKYFYPLDQARKEKMRAEARKAKAEKVKKISKDLQKKQDNAKKKNQSADKKEKPGAKTKSAPKKQKTPKATPKTTKKKTTQEKKKTPSDKSSKKSQSTGKKSKESKTRKPRQNKPLAQKIDKPLSEYHAFEELLPAEKLPELYDKAKTFARSVLGQAESTIRTLERMKGSRVSHVFEFHSKFSMAVACIIFLFIGAPMGAIVRKGGFGWPLLISIVFFVLYIILTIYHKNIAERFVIDAALAAWRPCLFYVPIGFGLTWMAMRDAGGMDFVALADRLGQYVRKILGIKTQNSSQLTDNQPIEK